MRYLFLALALLAFPAHAQTVSGCGTVAVAKADQTNATKLQTGIDCFAKAGVVAQNAVEVRKALLAKLNNTEPAPIPSNFDVAKELLPWGKHADREAAIHNETVGAFRFICSAGQILADDPIVYPGQPGKSHLHQFFGNDAADAGSTYATLRTKGGSTCQSPVNRASYWQSAMLNELGQVIRPDYWQIYYKRPPQGSPDCAPPMATACVGIPRGLKMIFGYDMISGKAGVPAFWMCLRNNVATSYGPDIPTAMAQCKAGDQMEVTIPAPACWDGKNVDSPNHRDHVSWRVHDINSGQDRCPASHPVMMPTFTLSAFWSIKDGENPALWVLSSDHMAPNVKPGTTFHADFFSAWDDGVENTWVANCIDRLLSCNSGDLGDGTTLPWLQNSTMPRIVDLK